MQFITIEGFESLSEQQMFDIALKHIGTTGVKSIKGAGCKYAGTGCNAAPFIRENRRGYADSRPNAGWRALARDGHVPSHNMQFVVDLQHAHDCCSVEYFKHDYTKNMRRLAGCYNLDTTQLDALGWATE